jgi:hypothetical protein
VALCGDDAETKRIAMTPRMEAMAKSRAVRSHLLLEVVLGLATGAPEPERVFAAPLTPCRLIGGFVVARFDLCVFTAARFLCCWRAAA